MTLIPDDEIPNFDEDAPFEVKMSVLNRAFQVFKEFINGKLDETNFDSALSLAPSKIAGTALTNNDVTDAPGKNPGKVIIPKGGIYIVTDPSNQISNALLTGTDTSNTDNGTLYGKITKTGPDHIVDLFSDSARTTKVATGQSTTATTTITLSDVSNSGIGGTIDIAYTVDDSAWTIKSDLKNGQVDMTGIKFLYERTVF